MSKIGDNVRIRTIAINLIDEIIAEFEAAFCDGIGEPEHAAAQAEALEMIGEHDPKMVARALLIAIADNLPRRPKPVLARSNDEEEGRT